MKSKARTVTKLKRSLRAISPVLSVLMMIAIAVAASLVAYAWIMGYIGGTTSKVGKAVMIQSMATNPANPDYLRVYVQNVGQGTVEFDPASCVYINDVRGTLNPLFGNLGININPLGEGQTATIELDLTALGISADMVKVKVVTKDGTFTETRDTISVSGLPGAYTLTLNSNPVGGGTVGTIPSAPYAPDTTVQLTANPQDGWSFSVWSGALSGSNNPETILMNGDKTVTATFTQNEIPFTPDVVGSGTVDKLPNQATYHLGDSVQLTANPAAGWTFSAWSGDPVVSGTLVIDATPQVTATFTLNDVAVTITSSTTGSGFVKVDGNAITTPQTFNWAPGSSHSLEALSPVSGGAGVQYVYSSWSDSGGQTHSYITPGSSATVTANYQAQYQLTMVTNFGTTTPAVGSTWYNAGATVTISATAPGAGGGERYVWNGWTGTGSGSYTGTNNPANNAVTMNAPITETASWTHQYQLTVTASPSGAIGGTFSVTYTQSGIVHTNEAHTTTWTGWADAGTSATVSSPQSPYGIYTFSSYTNNPATMNSAQTITLTYTAAPQTITLRPNAAGTTTQLENSGTGGANWDRVDEVTADESTTYVYGESDDNRETDTYNVADQSLAGTITNVRIYIRALENYDRDDVYAWTAIRIGTGSIQYGTQIDLTTSWTNYNTNYATKTGNLGSGAWTWADINNLQIGVGLQSHESSGPTWRYAECTQVWVEITYTP